MSFFHLSVALSCTLELTDDPPWKPGCCMALMSMFIGGLVSPLFLVARHITAAALTVFSWSFAFRASHASMAA